MLSVTNFCTELTTPEAELATEAICEADGLDGSPLTAFSNVLSEDLIALVWLGKSLLAELTNVVASLLIFCSCVFRPLTPLLTFRLVSPLIEFSRCVRSAQ